jgi:hypothetical protein
MATVRSISSVDALFEDIIQLQIQLADKILLLADHIDKVTDGKQYTGESNLLFVKYWCNVAIEHPEILAGDFPKDAFVERTFYYDKLVKIFKKNKEVMAIFNRPTANLSQDLMEWANDMYLNVKKRSAKNAVFKKILQESPQVYKKTKPDTDTAAMANKTNLPRLPTATG